MDFGGGDEIRFERIGRAGVVTLARPAALNALTHGMVSALAAALEAWRADDGVALAIIKGEGRAFSAGGDIMHIYEAGRAGRPPIDFFADEYRLNATIAAWPKPYVALVDGIVMGGGVGVSFHGSHRVLTENAQFAMPEVGIGFFPDVGASHLLPRLVGSFGVYLGLTGNRIGYGDALWSGLATHAVKAADLPEILEALCESGDPDPVLSGFATGAARETHDAAIHAIQRHFSRADLRSVLLSLIGDSEVDAFSERTLQTIRKRSPTSLEVAFRSISAGAMLGMKDCMRMEFRILNRMLIGHDFYEGIRAAIIDKGDRPRWDPPTLDAIDASAIEAYFAPLGDKELPL
jgi:enoyl-CoA hydratase